MTNTHKFSAAAAFGAAALFSMLSFGSNAEAASVLNCKGASATKVASCCEKVIAENGRRPLWMVQNRMNCHEATVCRGGGTIGVAALVINPCYINAMLIDGDGSNKRGGRRGSGAK